MSGANRESVPFHSPRSHFFGFAQDTLPPPHKLCACRSQGSCTRSNRWAASQTSIPLPLPPLARCARSKGKGRILFIQSSQPICPAFTAVTSASRWVAYWVGQVSNWSSRSVMVLAMLVFLLPWVGALVPNGGNLPSAGKWLLRLGD